MAIELNSYLLPSNFTLNNNNAINVPTLKLNLTLNNQKLKIKKKSHKNAFLYFLRLIFYKHKKRGNKLPLFLSRLNLLISYGDKYK